MSFILTVLGTGSALPTGYRAASAHVLNVHEHFFLIDCGEATQLQLKRYKVKFNRINHIFISHLHGDHYFGLPGLLSTLGLLGRKKEMHIYANKALEENLLNFFVGNELTFPLIFHSLKYDEPEVILDHKHLTVTSFPLKHRTDTCGFLFREKEKLPSIRKDRIQLYHIPISEIQKIKEGADFYSAEEDETIENKHLVYPAPIPRSYAYCSDTAYHEEIVPIIEGVDLLYHEATFDHDMVKMAKQTMHSTSVHAAIIAQKAKVKKLLIGHFSSRYRNAEKHLEQAHKMFRDTVALRDGDVFELPQEKRKQ